MRRALTEREAGFVQSCRTFAQQVIAPQVRALDEGNAFPEAVHAEAARWGLTYAGFAAELGGAGHSHLALVQGGLQWATVCAPTAFTLAFDHGALRPVLYAGTAEQKQRWVADLVGAGGHASWCMTEPHSSGSNLLQLETRAERVDGGWSITGDKCMVGMGTVASVFFVLADAWQAGLHLGPSVFAVPRCQGLFVGPNPPKLGFRCLPTPDVQLREVFVPDEGLIGEAGRGLSVLFDSLDYMRLGGGVVILGLVRGALGQLRDWLDTREVYGGQRLGDTSHVQITLGRLLARLRAAESLLFDAAEALDAGQRPQQTLAALKLLAADLAIETTSTTAQMWGWRGVREDYDVTKRLRDARQTSVYEGTSEVLAMNLFRGWASRPDPSSESEL